MFDFHETPQDEALGFHMSDREIVMAASLTLSSIHSTAFRLIRGSHNLDFDMGAVNLVAALCFPDTFDTDPGKATGWVTEVLDILTRKANELGS